MALLKEITTGIGVTVAYWKITDWKINQASKAVDIILTPYLSEQARVNGYEPMRDAVIKIRATDYFFKENSPVNRTEYTDYFSPVALENAVAQGKSIYNVMYDYIKLYHPDFKDAEDN
jgi:hypothetical protein